MDQMLRFVYIIVGFIAILFAAHYTTKWLGFKMGRSGPSNVLKVVERVGLGNESFVCLIKMDDIHYLLGVSKTNVTLLDKFDELNIDVKVASVNSFDAVISKYLKPKSQEPLVEERDDLV